MKNSFLSSLQSWMFYWETHSVKSQVLFFSKQILYSILEALRPQVEVTFKLHIFMEFIITCQTVFYSSGWYQMNKSAWFSNLDKQNHISTHAENHIDIYVQLNTTYPVNIQVIE